MQILSELYTYFPDYAYAMHTMHLLSTHCTYFPDYSYTIHTMHKHSTLCTVYPHYTHTREKTGNLPNLTLVKKQTISGFFHLKGSYRFFG